MTATVVILMMTDDLFFIYICEEFFSNEYKNKKNKYKNTYLERDFPFPMGWTQTSRR